MTCGIYKLNFAGTDKCYIGQSVNIEYRYTQHLYKLNNQTSSAKLLNAYSAYGKPSLEILVESDRSNLDEEEKEAIIIFNSVDNGFNTYHENRGSAPAARSSGEDSVSAIYSNAQIYEVLNYLVDQPHLIALDVSRETSVSVSTVRAIASLNEHKWLKLKYPEKYQRLEALKGMSNKSDKYSALARGIFYPPVVSPQGKIYHSITNVKKFCMEHGLTPSNFGEVLNGHRKSHKGWRVCQEEQV